MGHHRHIELVTDFLQISNLLSPAVLNLFAGLAFVFASMLALVSLKQESVGKPLAWSLIAISAIPLVSLLSSSMWIADLGGFPAIGSGQGIIKYFALTTAGIMLLNPTKLSLTQKKWIAVLPSMLVLLWIGGMKFTLLEAKGIEPLVQSSPLMSWMYQVWDLQTTSNLIGVYDLIALALLGLAIYIPKLVLPAIAMSGAVFLVTQTFLFSWHAALSAETLLSTGGHFLIKDVWYLVNLIWFCQLSQPLATIDAASQKA
ncbi:MAG: DUF417 family protein [Alteromonadaceae bacterium]|nr:DUF417 family protein [Alteromonadaceae bacterium]